MICESGQAVGYLLLPLHASFSGGVIFLSYARTLYICRRTRLPAPGSAAMQTHEGVKTPTYKCRLGARNYT